MLHESLRWVTQYQVSGGAYQSQCSVCALPTIFKRMHAFITAYLKTHHHMTVCYYLAVHLVTIQMKSPLGKVLETARLGTSKLISRVISFG